MPIRVSVVYVNFRCEALIARSIESILADGAADDLEFVVVDNSATEGKSSELSRREDLVYLESPSNPGFGTACNLGARAASAPVLVFLNPDTLCEAQVLRQLADHLAANPACGACGPELVDLSGNRQVYWNFHHLLSWELAEALYLQGLWRAVYERLLAARHPGGAPRNVPFVAGACLVVRKDLFEELGGFDPAFFLNYEDYELCDRVRDHGLSVQHLPRLRVVHYEGAIQRRDWANFVFHRIQAHAVYIRKRHHGWARMAASTILALSLLARIAVGVCFLRGDGRTRIRGYIRGLRLVVAGGST